MNKVFLSTDSVHVPLSDTNVHFRIAAKCITDQTPFQNPKANGAPALLVRAPVMLVLLMLGIQTKRRQGGYEWHIVCTKFCEIQLR